MPTCSMAISWTAARIRARWCCCCSHSKYPVRCVSQSALTPIHTPVLSCIGWLVVSGVAILVFVSVNSITNLAIFILIFSPFCFLSTPRHTVKCDTHNISKSRDLQGFVFLNRGNHEVCLLPAVHSVHRRGLPIEELSSVYASFTKSLATFLVRLAFSGAPHERDGRFHAGVRAEIRH
jgi:hypothetical protein